MTNSSYLRRVRGINLATYLDDEGEVRWSDVQDAVRDAHQASTSPKERALLEAEKRFGPKRGDAA